MTFIKPYLNLFSLGILLALVSAGVLGARAYNNNLREQGREEIRAEHLASDNTALREREREISRLLGVTRNWSDTNAEYLEQIDVLRSARAADAGRLQRLTAERRAAIAAASNVPALRFYATTAGDVYEACRERHRGLGLEADECAAAAHTLKGWADEVTTPKPTAPLSRLGSMFITTEK